MAGTTPRPFKQVPPSICTLIQAAHTQRSTGYQSQTDATAAAGGRGHVGSTTISRPEFLSFSAGREEQRLYGRPQGPGTKYKQCYCPGTDWKNGNNDVLGLAILRLLVLVFANVLLYGSAVVCQTQTQRCFRQTPSSQAYWVFWNLCTWIGMQRGVRGK